MKTTIKYILITVLFLTSYINGIGQNNTQLNEKYVLVVDVQEQNSHGDPDSISSLQLLPIVNSIIENTNPDKIIYIKSIHLALTISTKGISIDTLPDLKLDSRLNIVNKNVFEKSKPDAFSNNKLVDFLALHDAKEIIIVGLMAEHCVYGTALGAIKHDYDVYIVPEAIIGKSEKSKTKAINKLVKKGVKVIPLTEIVTTSN